MSSWAFRESGLQDGLGRSDEGDDRPVGCLTRVDIEDLDLLPIAFRIGDGFYYSVDNLFVASFAEVRDTFDDPFHGQGTVLVWFEVTNFYRNSKKTADS